MKSSEYTSLQFDLYIHRKTVDYGFYPTVIHFAVREPVNNNEYFFDELTRISKKYSIGPYVCFVFLDESILYEDLFPEELSSKIDLILFNDPKPLRTPAGELINQFNLQNKRIPIGVNGPDRGALVGSYEGLRFHFHPKESNRHHEKHIHCKCQNDEISIRLDPVEVIVGHFHDAKKERKALKIVEKYKEPLINYWDRVVDNGESIKLTFDFEL